MKHSKSFTLIELLIVIVIIGILATSLIPRLKGLQEKAKHTRIQRDFQDFRAAAFLAQSNTNKTLGEITNNYCSLCACRNKPLGTPYTWINIKMNGLAQNDECITTRESSLRKIEEAAGLGIGALSSMNRDPRGSPYLLDENEQENSGNPCRIDVLISVGPDGLFDSYNPGAPSDSKSISIPYGFCPGSY